MKKAKIMLTTIGVIAIVGGALAFKARYSHILYTGPAGGEICTETVIGATYGGFNRRVAVSTRQNDFSCPDGYTTTIFD